MIAATIIDPGVTTLLESPNARYYEGLLTHLLRGIHFNGILLLDKHSALTKPLRESNVIRQNVQLSALITSIVQDGSASIATRSNLTPAATIQAICEQYAPDIIATNEAPPYRIFGSWARKTQNLAEYHACDAESKRWQWAHGLGPFSTVGELSDVLRRVTKPSRLLRLYDAYFASEEGQSRRKRSLQLILNNWFQACCYPIAQRSLEIYCSHSSTTSAGLTRLTTDLRALQLNYPIKIDIHVMRNANAALHARYLQTANFAVMIDPGLDFFNGDDSLRHILMKPARGDWDHLRRVRSLEVEKKETIPAPRR